MFTISCFVVISRFLNTIIIHEQPVHMASRLRHICVTYEKHNYPPHFNEVLGFISDGIRFRALWHSHLKKGLRARHMCTLARFRTLNCPGTAEGEEKSALCRNALT